MRKIQRWFPLGLPFLALLLAVVLLPGGPVASAEDAPTPAPGPAGAGGEPAMGEEELPSDDEELDIPTSLDLKIKTSIERGVKWLKQAQKPDGSWGLIKGNAVYGGGKSDPNDGQMPAGSTALALFTLLKCKVPHDDPIVKKGFNFLRSKYYTPGSAYEVSMLLLAVTATADPFKKTKASVAQGERIKFPAGDWRSWAQKLHDVLLSKRQKAKKMGWRYNETGHESQEAPGGNEDLSSTQMAALALLAAERCGIKTESRVWNDLITYAMKQQEDEGPEWERAVYDRPPKDLDPKKLSDKDRERYGPQGGAGDGGKAPKDHARGYSYIKSSSLPADEGGATGGMTACGIGTIMMARYILMQRKDPLWEKRDQAAVQKSIYDGCAWLDMHWNPFENPQKRSMNVYHIYYMYCIERAFDLIGNQKLGKHMWYMEMASQLTGRQSDKGFWNSNSTHQPEEVLDTCFALLFLKRSTKGGIPYGSITGGGDEPPADNRGR
jgi:hypothetical protein